MKFAVLPPNTEVGIAARRVVIVADADRGQVNPNRLGGPVTFSGSSTAVEFKAPDTPGKYVVRVDIDLTYDPNSVEEFEVKEAKKP
jgi:hypothetical protein